MRECKAVAAAAPLPGRRAGASWGAVGCGGHRGVGHGERGQQGEAVYIFLRSMFLASAGAGGGLRGRGRRRSVHSFQPLSPQKGNRVGGKMISWSGCGARPRLLPPDPSRAGPGTGGGRELCLLRKVERLHSSPTAVLE